MTHISASVRRWLIPTAGAAVLLAGTAVGGYALGHGSGPSTPPATAQTQPAAAQTQPAAAPSSGSSDGGCPSASPTPSAGMSSSNDALGQLIGREAGTRLAGNAPLTVTQDQVTALGNQVPAGATVDRCADRITVTAHTVTLVIEASPAANPDMTFRIAGLVNPTVVVPAGTLVTVEFVNADSDEAHAWVVTSQAPPFPFDAATPPAITGAAAAVIGDPTAAGHGARMVTFTASPAGTYRYICPMPGHAQMGMHGTFVVT